MGRSRAVHHPADDDPHQSFQLPRLDKLLQLRHKSSLRNLKFFLAQFNIFIQFLLITHNRSKRKRSASNVENMEGAVAGQEMNEGKKALYHCNYCNKDISGKIRIKCVMCSDFDLCVECFSVGAEVYPHKSNHPYRVM
ncbi:hypothetical protein RJ639_011235, partial [Escallonia herrerae]